MLDKLERWIELLSQSGKNTKQQVLEEMKIERFWQIFFGNNSTNEGIGAGIKQHLVEEQTKHRLEQYDGKE